MCRTSSSIERAFSVARRRSRCSSASSRSWIMSVPKVISLLKKYTGLAQNYSDLAAPGYLSPRTPTDVAASSAMWRGAETTTCTIQITAYRGVLSRFWISAAVASNGTGNVIKTHRSRCPRGPPIAVCYPSGPDASMSASCRIPPKPSRAATPDQRWLAGARPVSPLTGFFLPGKLAG
jgi:hypothetical protein